jgi:uncharacterized protein YaaW (UPF0174 family)
LVDSKADKMAVEWAARRVAQTAGVSASKTVASSVELRVVMMVFGLVGRWAASSADVRVAK